jgi:hypothetical protein
MNEEWFATMATLLPFKCGKYDLVRCAPVIIAGSAWLECFELCAFILHPAKATNITHNRSLLFLMPVILYS